MSAVSKVVVTGGAGFIGSHLVKTLAAARVQVSVVDNLSTGSWTKIPEAASKSVNCLEADCSDAEALKRAFDGADCVFHLAAVSSVGASLRDPLGNLRSGEAVCSPCLKPAVLQDVPDGSTPAQRRFTAILCGCQSTRPTLSAL